MLPTNRQTLMFSATMPHEITKLAASILIDPVKVEVTPPASTVDLIDQTIYFVEKKDKKFLLNMLLKDESIDSALIFTRTKHGADKVVKDLASANISAQAIHGNKSQSARQLALNNFKLKQTRVLVATDIAARGIDVPELSHVINYEMPNIPETYVHRIGRTGRAGLVGTAVSFCDIEEREYLKDIQKLISKKIAVVEDHPYKSTLTEADLKQMAVTQSRTPDLSHSRTSGLRPAQQRNSQDSRAFGPRQPQQRINQESRAYGQRQAQHNSSQESRPVQSPSGHPSIRSRTAQESFNQPQSRQPSRPDNRSAR
jgi:ATP-dependent RNA helicase RhlE